MGAGRKGNPQIPVLHASLGRALLSMKGDPEEALKVFEEGLRADANNQELYTGMDQSLSILQRPAKDRVADWNAILTSRICPLPWFIELAF